MTTSIPTSSSAAVASSSQHHYILAQRCGGVCEGTLWQTMGTSSSSSWSFFGSAPEKVYTYSVLCGVRLVSYEHYSAYERGDRPTSIVRIVGASSSPTTTAPPLGASRKYTATKSSKAASSVPTNHHLATTAAAVMDFRIVSDQGTHVHCQTASTACRQIWLAAIQSALEQQLLHNHNHPPLNHTSEGSPTQLSSSNTFLLPPPPPKLLMTNRSVTNVVERQDDKEQQTKLFPPPAIPIVCQESYYRDNTNYTSSQMLLKGFSMTSTKMPKYCRSCGAVECNGTNLFELMMMNQQQAKMNNHSISGTSSPSRLAGRSVSRNSSNSSSDSNHDGPSKRNHNHPSPGKKKLKKRKSSSNIVTVATCSTMMTTQYTPLMHYGIETKIHVCTSCYIAQGLLDYIEFCQSLYEYRIQEYHSLQSTSLLFWKTIYQTYRNKPQPQQHDDDTAAVTTSTKKKKTTTTTTKKKKDKSNHNPDVVVSSEVVGNMPKVQDGIEEGMGEPPQEIPPPPPPPPPPISSSSRRGVEDLTFEEYYPLRWEYPLPDGVVTSLTALMQLSTEFASYRRQSVLLDTIYHDYFYAPKGGKCLSSIELLEMIDEMAGCYHHNEKQYYEKKQLAHLKKQAFRMAGDMGTAMKLLVEILLSSSSSSSSSSRYYSHAATTMTATTPHAASSSSLAYTTSKPSSYDMNHHHHNATTTFRADTHHYSSSSSSSSSSPNYYASMMKKRYQNQQQLLDSSSNNPYDMEMLACVLEYLLDMCEHGEISTIAFFWPQLCHVHLRMLPAKNAIELTKIDMMEDFLLTVSTKYSIHLALELTWNHIADLEESFGIASSSSSSSMHQPSATYHTNNIRNGSTSVQSATSPARALSPAPVPTVGTNEIDELSISPRCRQRRFAVLRFLCELESLLFDEDHIRWGIPRQVVSTTTKPSSSTSSTPTTTTKHHTTKKRTVVVGSPSVALGNLLSPTQHQFELLQQASVAIQSLRNEIMICKEAFLNDHYNNNNNANINPQTGQHPDDEAVKLSSPLSSSLPFSSSTLSLYTRSIRYEQQYKRNSLPIQLHRLKQQPMVRDDATTTEKLVATKLRIARNVDYYSCHLNFTRRLTDIAEKLRFIDIEKRSNLLQHELDLLNCSGMMGGDPLNRIVSATSITSGNNNNHGDSNKCIESMEDICSFIRVVRIPSSEGHVFRSKERTPVLLLIEVIDESSYMMIDYPSYDKDRISSNHHNHKQISNNNISNRDVPSSSSTTITDIHESGENSKVEHDNASDILVQEKSITETKMTDIDVNDTNTDTSIIRMGNGVDAEPSKISRDSSSRRFTADDIKDTSMHQSLSASSFYSAVSSDADMEEIIFVKDDATNDHDSDNENTKTNNVSSNGDVNPIIKWVNEDDDDDNNNTEWPISLHDDVQPQQRELPQINQQQQRDEELIQYKRRSDSDGHQLVMLKYRTENLYGMQLNNNDKDGSSSSLSTPSRHHTRSLSDSMDLLEGASSGITRKSPRPGALKRFDDSIPVTPKKDVEKLVSSVVEHQLQELSIPELSKPRTVNMLHQFEAIASPSNAKTPEMSHDQATSTGKVEGNTGNDSMATEPSRTKKLSTLGSIVSGIAARQGSNAVFAPTGDFRHEVLTTIMMHGIQGNTIAAGAADAVQLSLKELGRKRATELLMKDDSEQSVGSNYGHYKTSVTNYTDTESTRRKMESLGLSPVNSAEDDELSARRTDEDEVLEAIRLILIQNRVAQGLLTPEDAAKVLQHTSLSPTNYSASARSRPHASSKQHRHSNKKSAAYDVSDHPTIDAGDVDPRLVGCGPLPPAILQAMTLWKAEMVSNAELLELVKKDIEFMKHSVLVSSDSINKLKENSAFWGRFAFGERWAEKKSRIASSSPQGSLPGWDLLGVIVKSNDDLRQEAFIMQLIELCKEAFEIAGLELWVSPYRILATGRTTGIIECVRNAMSFDALKKRPGYGKGGLREHLHRMTQFTADPGEAFKTAQRNFVRSLAAYSLMSYFFLFKDRHNGNILLDTAGHVVHIDFGFVFGVAPGGSFSLEMSTPFKLTEEMLDVMGGLRSPLFSEFVTLFCCGFLALQSHCDTFLTIVEIVCAESTFKCFEGRDPNEIVSKLRERFCPDLNKEETVSYALDLIKQATTSYGTRQYDIFQYLSQGIVA